MVLHCCEIHESDAFIYDKITPSRGSKFVVSIISKDFNQVAAGWIGDLGEPDPVRGPYFRDPCSTIIPNLIEVGA